MHIGNKINQYTGTVHFVFVSLKPLGERNMAPFMLELDMQWTLCM